MPSIHSDKSKLTATPGACDLCGLDVGFKPFYLESAGKRLQFCCDGCLGIYQMLHEFDPPATPNDTHF